MAYDQILFIVVLRISVLAMLLIVGDSADILVQEGLSLTSDCTTDFWSTHRHNMFLQLTMTFWDQDRTLWKVRL